MPTQRFTVPSDNWALTASVEATANTDILFTHHESNFTDIHWAVTADNTPPAFAIESGHPVQPGEKLAIQLQTGEFLWFGAAKGTLDITVTDVPSI